MQARLVVFRRSSPCSGHRYLPGARSAPLCSQGGVAFKPGNIITARVGRALQREVLNFGFSGERGCMLRRVGALSARVQCPVQANMHAAAWPPLLRPARAEDVCTADSRRLCYAIAQLTPSTPPFHSLHRLQVTAKWSCPSLSF